MGGVEYVQYSFPDTVRDDELIVVHEDAVAGVEFVSLHLEGDGVVPAVRARYVSQYAPSFLAEEATSSIDRAMEARLAARKAVSVSSPSASTGLRDVASAKKFVLPGQCTISNFHMLICCLMRKSLTLGT